MSKPVLCRAAFLPDWRIQNPYQTLMAEALAHEGVQVAFHPMPRGIFALNRLPASVLANQVIHLHWINDLIGHIAWPQGSVSRWIKLVLLALDILLVRMRGRRVVWTVHNLVTHESQNVGAELAARRVVARACSRLIFHSKSAMLRVEEAIGIQVGNKASIIPHGNYDGCYAEDADGLSRLRQRLGVDTHTTNLLFFGAIRRYKGVIPLMEAFASASNQNLRLIIAGNPNEPDLKQAIKSASKSDSRIMPVLEFIPDDAVASFFALADAAIIPFERTLTSGSAILALTMGKATLLPEAARVFDLVDDRSSIFFESADDLKRVLDSLGKEDLAARGVHARKLADAVGWPEIAKAIKQVYVAGVG